MDARFSKTDAENHRPPRRYLVLGVNHQDYMYRYSGGQKVRIQGWNDGDRAAGLDTLIKNNNFKKKPEITEIEPFKPLRDNCGTAKNRISIEDIKHPRHRSSRSGSQERRRTPSPASHHIDRRANRDLSGMRGAVRKVRRELCGNLRDGRGI